MTPSKGCCWSFPCSKLFRVQVASAPLLQVVQTRGLSEYVFLDVAQTCRYIMQMRMSNSLTPEAVESRI